MESEGFDGENRLQYGFHGLNTIEKDTKRALEFDSVANECDGKGEVGEMSGDVRKEK